MFVTSLTDRHGKIGLCGVVLEDSASPSQRQSVVCAYHAQATEIRPRRLSWVITTIPGDKSYQDLVLEQEMNQHTYRSDITGPSAVEKKTIIRK